MIPQQLASKELREVFGAQLTDTRNNPHLPPGGRPAAVEVCYIHDGQHYGPPGCAHERTEDELGEIKPAGWTVQQRRTPSSD